MKIKCINTNIYFNIKEFALVCFNYRRNYVLKMVTQKEKFGRNSTANCQRHIYTQCFLSKENYIKYCLFDSRCYSVYILYLFFLKELSIIIDKKVIKRIFMNVQINYQIWNKNLANTKRKGLHSNISRQYPLCVLRFCKQCLQSLKNLCAKCSSLFNMLIYSKIVQFWMSVSFLVFDVAL